MSKALISITAALAIFAAGSAIGDGNQFGKCRAPGVYGKNGSEFISPRQNRKKSSQRRWRGDGFLVIAAGSAQTSPGK